MSSSRRVGSSDDKPVASEGTCQLCNNDNPVWFAPNELWNRVMRYPDGREISEKYHFVCPNCFIKQAEALGVNGVWELHNG